MIGKKQWEVWGLDNPSSKNTEVSVDSLMKSLAPMLEGWLKQSLTKMGIAQKESSKDNKKLLEKKTKRETSSQKIQKPPLKAVQSENNNTSRKEGWNTVIGRKAKGKTAKTDG